LSKKRSIQHKKGPVRIAQPLFAPNSNSNSDSEEIQVKTGEKRAATSSVDANERATHRRRTEPDDVVMEEVVPSFIDKVRQDKEKKLVNSRSTSVAIPEPRATASVATTHTKRSMAEYRASRGLSSVTTSTNRIPLPPRQNSSSGSSLFINRKKPAVSVSS
jgi:isochorismate synthase EntC